MGKKRDSRLMVLILLVEKVEAEREYFHVTLIKAPCGTFRINWLG